MTGDAPAAGRTRSAVVTGAASGIGRNVATMLLDRGWIVIATDRDADGLQSIPDPIADGSGEIRRVAGDLEDLEATTHAIVREVETLPRLDGLANVAGIFDPLSMGQADTERFERHLRVNLTAPWLLADLLWEKLANGGRIVNAGSLAAGSPFPGSVAYTCSKAGLVGLTNVLHASGRKAGIEAHCINFGWVDTPLVSDEAKSRATTTLDPESAAAEIARLLCGGGSPRGAVSYPMGAGGT